MNKKTEYFFKEGCYIEEWLNTPNQTELSIARVRVEPNTQTKLHALAATTERYAILSGEGTVTVGKKSWLVAQGDVVVINPNQAQKIRNDINQDLVFLAICTPRFEEQNYQELLED